VCVCCECCECCVCKCVGEKVVRELDQGGNVPDWSKVVVSGVELSGEALVHCLPLFHLQQYSRLRGRRGPCRMRDNVKFESQAVNFKFYM